MEKINPLVMLSVKITSITKVRIALIGLSLVMLSLVFVQAQPPPVANPIILERYVSSCATSSQFIYDEIGARDSDGICNSGTRIQIAVFGNTSMVSGDIKDIEKTRIGGGPSSDRPFRAQIGIDWVANQTGILTVDVYYERREHTGGLSCSWEPWTYMYTYKIYKQDINPEGTISGATTLQSVNINGQAGAVFNLNYRPASTFRLGGFDAKRIQYWNGNEFKETPIDGVLGLYLSTPVTFHANNVGSFPLNIKVLDQCGNWFQAVSIALTVVPSCSQYNPLTAAITIENEVANDGAVKIIHSTPYKLIANGVTDFNIHYDWSSVDGGGDIQFNGDFFTLVKELGSYSIEAKRKPGRGSCPELPPLKVYTTGKNLQLKQICSITLPDALGEFGYDVKSGDIVLEHLAATFESKRSIIVMPGVTLDLGAELTLNAPPTLPGNDPDKSLNFTEEHTYDEYGRILSSSRTYFDDQGAALQTQFKNLSSEVVLANETLYDAYGRAALTTLSAPVRANDQPLECAEDNIPGSTTFFTYKPDFIKAVDGNNYIHTHFDLANEETPLPVDATTEGTLGWYYSAYNGSSTSAKMNEKFVAQTSYPYSRTLFHRDGSGEVKSGTKPGDAFRAGSGNLGTSNTEKVAANDTYLTAYLNMRLRELGLPIPTLIESQFFRSVSIDAQGKKSISYTDKGGNTIISLYFGTQVNPITTSYQFYDDAGRLKVSVSPNGVAQYSIVNNVSNFHEIDKTTYTYNYKGWLLKMCEKDAGCTEYVYRKDGKIRFSQNAVQLAGGKYSYTHYDRSGRPIESGEYTPVSITFNSEAMKNILENVQTGGGLPNEGSWNDRTFTYYDLPATTLATTLTELALPVQRTQRFVHGAVSISRNENVTTWYSYDERGRVEWMVQNIAGFGTKTVDYRYGPTGAVQDVVYQKGIADEQFTHYYEYDFDGRLFKVNTTRDAIEYKKTGELVNAAILELQATYYYYLHGPLKRIEYANNVQGIDYVYTADGALKSINDANQANDPGQDGMHGSTMKKDVFGMTLDYFSGDYLNSEHTPSTAIAYPAGTIDQFTGLIKGNRWHSPTGANTTNGYAYRYDERNQLADARWLNAIPNVVSPYLESVGQYDVNGNIKSLQRNNNWGSALANFSYNYAAHSNKLQNIQHNNTSYRTYTYNSIGQTTEQTDADGKKLKMTYDVSGKVTAVRNENDVLVTTFEYDDRGFRLNKTTFDASGNAVLITWYVRDASGNVLSTYEQNASPTDGAMGEVVPTEMPVYASGKIGLYKPQYGYTFYEVTDHLGNVRAVITDTVTVFGEYMATMEPERTNPADNMEGDFRGITAVPTAEAYNHTPTSVTVGGEKTIIPNPHHVIRINNGLDNPRKPVGGGIMLWVHPGDKLNAEVFVKYADFDQQNTTAIEGIAGYLATSFGAGSFTLDGANIFAGLDSQVPTGVFTSLNDVDDTQPRAFLSYIVFDKNMVPVKFDYAQVSEAAAVPQGILNHEHERLFHDITIEHEGFIYIYVSNESDQHMDVYFDDLKVRHEYSNIVAGSDFYPFGLEMKDRSITREFYRYGYQGQFAEKDDETGWNHFELREYDPVIGRWLAPDPYSQYWSPYVGMGNEPVRGTDPDGGKCKTCPNNKIYDDYRNSNLDYAFSALADGDGVYQMLPELVFRGPAGDKFKNSINAGRNEFMEEFTDFMSMVPGGQVFMISSMINQIEKGNGEDVALAIGMRMLKIPKATQALGALKTTLPAWKKVSVDIGHIASGHIKGGSRVSKLKTLFPEGMTSEQVLNVVIKAYRNVHTKLQTQGERILLRGDSDGTTIEMWLNITTKTIETAYPVK
jgi:RHS repeat-associated protein